MSEQQEMKTPGGFSIRVFRDRGVCNVSRDGRLEFPQGGSGSSDQPVPGIIFIGKSFEPSLPVQEFVLVPNRSRRLVIPYRLGESRGRHLLLPCGSAADQFPVMVAYFDSSRQLVDAGFAYKGPPWRYVVLEPRVARIDLMSLKVHRPELKTFLLKEEVEAQSQAAAVAEEKVRATDIVKQGSAGDQVSNPVFQARLHLRNLALERMTELPVRFSLKPDEVEFIRTFLSLMIQNERGSAELEKVKEQLQRLDEFYRLLSVALQDPDEFDRSLGQGVGPGLARILLPVVRNMRSQTQDREQQIRFWEWEYRLNDLSGD
ncbi:MAG: hypothetical protein CMN76_10345 [Spirochaetaceae bacterium]|nr:hypothetical protein [Spirochaetaceae bacterium]